MVFVTFLKSADFSGLGVTLSPNLSPEKQHIQGPRGCASCPWRASWRRFSPRTLRLPREPAEVQPAALQTGQKPGRMQLGLESSRIALEQRVPYCSYSLRSSSRLATGFSPDLPSRDRWFSLPVGLWMCFKVCSEELFSAWDPSSPLLMSENFGVIQGPVC